MKVGVTGHQNLGSAADGAWVREAMGRVLNERDVTIGMTSLAAGADQLFAELLYQMGKPYKVIVPSASYESTFAEPQHRQQYLDLLLHSQDQLILPFPTPNEEAFFAAGMRIVDESDLMVAVWNGQPAGGLGGTGDVVRYAREQGKRVIHINPVARTVSVLEPRVAL